MFRRRHRRYRRQPATSATSRTLLCFTRCFTLLTVLSCIVEQGSAGNPDAKRLYDDLLSNYNKLVRPVINVSDALEVKIKLKLSQLIDVVSKKNIHIALVHPEEVGTLNFL